MNRFTQFVGYKLEPFNVDIFEEYFIRIYYSLFQELKIDFKT